jgi:isopentenyl phosphate kinase
LKGRIIKEGRARGTALVSSEPIGFLGGVDPETGLVVEKGHPLEGQSVAGRVLVFPTGKGSTVGSYTLYRLTKKGLAPAAIINAQSEPIVAVGAIISDIPMVDQVDIGQMATGDHVSIEGEVIEIACTTTVVGELVFLKLGGSVITDKKRESTAREDVIHRACQEISRALKTKSDLSLVLGHGSGSFGHFVANRYGLRDGIQEGPQGPQSEDNWRGYAETAAAAARLNRLVADIFLAEGLPIFTLQPSASALCRSGELISMETHPVAQALSHGLIPLVYGDVAFDKVWGCTIISTEQIFACLAHELRPSRIILASIVEGVYDSDPLQNPQARLFQEIGPGNIAQVEQMLSGSHGVDVTGGMLTKVREMYTLVRSQPSLSVHLISGQREGLIEKTLLGQASSEGTLIR